MSSLFTWNLMQLRETIFFSTIYSRAFRIVADWKASFTPLHCVSKLRPSSNWRGGSFYTGFANGQFTSTGHQRWCLLFFQTEIRPPFFCTLTLLPCDEWIAVIATLYRAFRRHHRALCQLLSLSFFIIFLRLAAASCHQLHMAKFDVTTTVFFWFLLFVCFFFF